MKILVVNAGSSSLKYQLIDMDTEEVRRGRERFPLKNDRRPELYRRISLLSV